MSSQCDAVAPGDHGVLPHTSKGPASRSREIIIFFYVALVTQKSHVRSWHLHFKHNAENEEGWQKSHSRCSRTGDMLHRQRLQDSACSAHQKEGRGEAGRRCASTFPAGRQSCATRGSSTQPRKTLRTQERFSPGRVTNHWNKAPGWGWYFPTLAALGPIAEAIEATAKHNLLSLADVRLDGSFCGGAD